MINGEPFCVEIAILLGNEKGLWCAKNVDTAEPTGKHTVFATHVVTFHMLSHPAQHFRVFNIWSQEITIGPDLSHTYDA